MHILRRLALITTIYRDIQLRSARYWPITPLQSELLLQKRRLPNPKQYQENLALILYDRSGFGSNLKEAMALYESLKQYQSDLELSNLEQSLLIINPGIEPDASMPYGVKPIVLPGVTKAYAHETLNKTGEYTFKYGLEHGLPSVSDLGRGNRELYMPEQSKKNTGLRVLCRHWNLNLGAGVMVPGYLDVVGRVTFCREVTI